MKDLDRHVLQNLETYKDFMDHAHDLIHILEPDGAIIYVNKSWERILGYRLTEVQGHLIYSFIAQEDRDDFKSYRERVIYQDALDEQVVVRLRSKTGKLVTVEGVVSLKRDGDTPVYTRGIFRDISTRLHNEKQLQLINEALKEREANLQQLLINAPDAIVVIDESSEIIFWNPKAVTLFGWTPEEAVGKKLADTIIPVQYRDMHEQGMQRYIRTREAHVLNKTVQLSALNKDGNEFFVSLTISETVQNGDRGFIAFIRNIDQEKKNELELIRKQKELEQSNEELEQFAYVTSHDLQEPLRKILFYTSSIIENDGSSGKSSNYLLKVNKSAARMKEMIKSLLDFSRLSQKHRFEKVNLNLTVENVITDFELLMKEKNALIEKDELPVIDAIAIQMQQLFSNLIHNALKFSKDNEPSLIRITCEKQPGNKLTPPVSGDCYEIQISDNGIGFNPQYAEKIFTIFQRLNQEIVYDGYGIGLSICKKIVDRHNGLIKAESKSGEGAKFTVILLSQQWV